MKIYFLPPGSELNKSLDMIVEGLEYNGAEVVNKKYNQGAFKKLASSYIAYFQGARIFHLNFIENYSANKTIKSIIACNMIFLWLRSLKVLGGKLVWTMNNKESHYCKGDKTFHYAFLKKFISMMDVIVVYCQESKDILETKYNYPSEKICSVVHGAFIPERKFKDPDGHKELRILSFGLISKYKQIPALVKAYKEANLENAELKIVGKCETESLDHEIRELIKNTEHIAYDNRFVSDEEVDSLFEWADIAVFPYGKDSMLNSGAVIMALSQGKPILVSEFGYIKEIKNNEFVFSYDYENAKEKVENLVAQLKLCEKVHQENPYELSRLGKEAYAFAHDNLDWKAICKKIVDYYKK